MLEWLRKYGYFTVDNAPTERYWGKGYFKSFQSERYDTRSTYFSKEGIAFLQPLIAAAIANKQIKEKIEREYKAPNLNDKLIKILN